VKWKTVAGAGGYLAEVKNSHGDVVVAQQAAPDQIMLELHLVPGPYALRVTTLNRFLKPESDTGWLSFHVDAATAPVVADSPVLTLHPGNTGTLTLPVTGLAEDATAALKSPSGTLIPIDLPALVDGSIPLALPVLSEKGAWSIVLSNPPSQTITVTGRINVQDPDFMFIYPTIFGPAVSFQDKTYGTGFGLDASLVKRIQENQLSTPFLDSYEGKVFWGNVVFYPSLGLSYVGVGLLGVLVANMTSGSAYEDLSLSIAAYNGPSDKVTFDLRQFGYKLRWNDQVFDPHDSKVLDVLSTDAQGKALVESYRSKTTTASILGWAGLGAPVVGTFLVTSSASSGDLNGAAIGVLLAGAGVASWIISNFVGASGESDLVQSVKLYDKTH